MTPAGGLLWLLAAAAAPDFPSRHLDLEATAFASLPERFALCLGAHPAGAVEADLCVGGHAGLLSVAAHGAWRKRWLFPHTPGHAFTLAVGPALGVRVLRFGPFGPSATAAGPELLASVEAVQWLGGLGLTFQLDGGLALLWAPAAPGLLELMLRFPLRLLVGVAF